MASLAELAHTLRALKGRTLITFHTLGDADAVCSALVLQKLLRTSAEVRSPDALSAHARHVLRQLELPEPPLIEHLNYDNLVLVDVSTPVLLGDWAHQIQQFKGTKIIIDHHAHKIPLRADCYYNDWQQGSTGEIIYKLARYMRHTIREQEALLLLTSVIRDTALFRSATSYSFEVVSALLRKTKWPYSKVRGLADNRPDVSERIARLKAGQRAQLYKAGDLVVATAVVNAFELGCASALVEAGADVAFAANPSASRISAVKRETLVGVHIARVMEKAGYVLEGSGGGRETVGGAQGQAHKLSAALEACVEWTAQQVGAKEVKQL